MAKGKKANGKANGAKSAEGTTNAKHNVANRNRIMTDALAETYKLDTQIQAALEKHVAPLRAHKADIKSKLNKDLNITATVFNARYAPYKLEATARAASDDATLDNLRELFEVSPVGTQMDMMAGLGSAKGNGADKAPAKSKPKTAKKKPKTKPAAESEVPRGARA